MFARSFLAVLTVLAALFSCPAGAQDTQPQIFAYPGHACPTGSRLLKGPETRRAESSGAVYCVFQRLAYSFSKDATAGRCPPGYEPYRDAEYQPDADTLWCSRLTPHLPAPIPPAAQPSNTKAP